MNNPRTLVIQRAMLVYQAGIANVFAVDHLSIFASNRTSYDRNARRLIQGAFRECELFARGLNAAGTLVNTAACNQAGNIARSDWSQNLEDQPFSESFRPVRSDGVA